MATCDIGRSPCYGNGKDSMRSFRLIRPPLFRLLVPPLAIILTLVLCEIGHRIVRFWQLSHGQLNYVIVPNGFYQFDAKSGYRYAPNKDFVAEWVANGTVIVRSSYVHTNSQGHVSPEEEPPKSDPHRIRIAVLGDSLSACIHSDVRWPHVLEEDLNSDHALRARLGGRRFEVINFSRDGIGLSQFPAIVDNEIAPYHPDLTLINFITADIYRRFVWRRTISLPDLPRGTQVVLNCVSLPATLSNPECSFAGAIALPPSALPEPALLSSINQVIARHLEARLPWFSLYPDFITSLLGDKLLAFLGRNPFHPESPTIKSRSLSIALSAQAIREIRSRHPNTLFLHLPTYWELYYNAIPKLAGEVMHAVPKAGIIPMIDYMPPPFDKPHVNSWTNYPYDMHFSNEGATVYAHAVHELLKERLQLRRRLRLAHEDRPLGELRD